MRVPALAIGIEDLIRTRGPFAVGRGHVPVGMIALIAVLGGFGYGLAMGSFGARPLQMLYSGVKVPLLLGVSTIICVPSFYVLNSVMGLRDDFSAALRGILAAQAVLAVCLLAMAPWPVLVYVSTEDYVLATNFNGIPFLLGALAGQSVLARHYRPLIARDARHRVPRNLWLLLYVFVSIQFAWVLRPFIGNPAQETEFLREDAWSNAFVAIGGDLLRLFGG
ncbi:MAG: hypothetical protein R3F20_10445 [Planctomycetota bacterium]